MKKVLFFMAASLLVAGTMKAQIIPQGIRVYDQLPPEANTHPRDAKIHVHFHTAVFELDSVGKVVLDSVYSNLLVNDPVHFYKVTVTGHADSVGTDSFNLALSQKRAESVYYYLTHKDSTKPISKSGMVSYNSPCEGVRYVSKTFHVNMTKDWKGEKEPIADNGTDAGRQQNRRTTIWLQDDPSEYPVSRVKCMVPETDQNYNGTKNTHVYVPAGSIMTVDSLPFECNSHANVDITETYGMDDVVKSAPLIDAKGKSVLYLGKVDLMTTPAFRISDCKQNAPANNTTFTVEIPVTQKMLDQDVKVYYYEYDTSGNKSLKRAQTKRSNKTNGEISLEFVINPFTTGTIFLGKELSPAKRVKKYSYRMKKDNGQPYSLVNGKKYTFAKVKGSKTKYKKKLKKLF